MCRSSRCCDERPGTSARRSQGRILVTFRIALCTTLFFFLSCSISSSSWRRACASSSRCRRRNESRRAGSRPPCSAAAATAQRGSVVVPAVAEVAAGGEGVDVGEGVLEAAFPELHLAHPRRVDEEPAAGQLEQLAVGGGVPAARVGGADLGRPLALVAAQPVDQRRLADAGRAEEGAGLADGEIGRAAPRRPRRASSSWRGSARPTRRSRPRA